MSIKDYALRAEYQKAYPEFISKFYDALSETFQIAILENSTGKILYSYSFPKEIIPMVPLYNYHVESIGWGLGVGWK